MYKRQGEQRRVQILRDIQHAVDEAGIQVDVRAHGDRLVLARHDLPDAELLNALHELEVVSPALVAGKRGGVFLDDQPIPETMAFFNNNRIVNYTLEKSIVDGVNVDCRVYSCLLYTSHDPASIASLGSVFSILNFRFFLSVPDIMSNLAVSTTRRR